MPNIGPLELIVVLVIALLILGPGKLPEVGAALGKSIREFRRAATDIQEVAAVNAAPGSPAAATAPTIPTAPGTLASLPTVGDAVASAAGQEPAPSGSQAGA